MRNVLSKLPIKKSEGLTIVGVVLVCLFIVFFGVRAGSLSPSASPASTFYTLKQLYDPLASTSFDSSGFSADQNGSLIEILRYIAANTGTSQWTSSGNNIRNANSGYVGIGLAVPTAKLDVYATSGNAAGAFVGLHAEHVSIISTTGMFNRYGGQFSITSSISAGITNTGAETGVHGAATRTLSSDAGTLSILRGMFVEIGHTGANAAATTTNAFGIRINESASTGTITNLYGLYLDPTNTGGTLTNSYGIYLNPISGSAQTYGVYSNNGVNYFAGRTGIGTATPTTKLEVQGTASASYLLTGRTLQTGGLATVSYNRFGVSQSTGHSLASADDLEITGMLEVDGAAYFDNTVTAGGRLFVTTGIGIGVSGLDSPFEIIDSGAATNTASISATSLSTGSLFKALVPVSSSFTGNIFHISDTTGRTLFRVSSGGQVAARQAIFSHGSTTNCTGVDAPSTGCIDYAEDMPTQEMNLLPGELVIIKTDTGEEFSVQRSDKAYDALLLGIVSTKPAIVIGNSVRQGDFALERIGGSVPVALAGRVPVKISLENGPIRKGDYLTSSSRPGRAMKATRAGRVIGMALENAYSEDALVMTFVNPHYAGYELDARGSVAQFSEPLLESSPSLLASIIDALKDAAIHVRSLTADSIETDHLNVKEGVTVEDEVTGDPYCVSVAQGQIKTTLGNCGGPVVTATPEPTSTPSIEPTPSETPVVSDIPVMEDAL